MTLFKKNLTLGTPYGAATFATLDTDGEGNLLTWFLTKSQRISWQSPDGFNLNDIEVHLVDETTAWGYGDKFDEIVNLKTLRLRFAKFGAALHTNGHMPNGLMDLTNPEINPTRKIDGHNVNDIIRVMEFIQVILNAAKKEPDLTIIF